MSRHLRTSPTPLLTPDEPLDEEGVPLVPGLLWVRGAGSRSVGRTTLWRWSREPDFVVELQRRRQDRRTPRVVGPGCAPARGTTRRGRGHRPSSSSRTS